MNSDIFEKILEEKNKNFFQGKLDVVISDMAADTTGNKSLIRLEQINYVQRSYRFILKILKNEGIFVQNYLWVGLYSKLKI